MTFLLMALVFYLCFSMAMEDKASISLCIGLLPLIGVMAMASVRWPGYLLVLAFIVNYLVMGAGRYISIPVPITLIFEALFAVLILCYMLRSFRYESDWTLGINLYWMFTALWMIYCLVNAFNGITGETRVVEWFKNFCPLALFPFVISIIIGLYARHYSFIQKLMILWGIFIILAAMKGYWQRNKGFDDAEWRWVMTEGYSTHILITGVRYFSFFTDAASLGCGMAAAMVTYGISALYVKKHWLRIFYIIVACAGGYCMLISGTRAALAAPIVGIAMYTVLCKNWKIFLAASISLGLGLFILMFTTIGDSNSMVHRMRTAFDKDDASMNVRYENQKAIKAYMAEAPFGIGMGLNGSNVSPKNKFYLPAFTPPDSDWVNIWIHLGAIGLGIYLLIQAFVLGTGSYYLLFRIKSDEIRGPLTGMLCGSGGLLMASYANMVYFQFPNGPLMYTCLTLVFMGPYFDRQYIEEHDHAKA
jgi:hypothetical protein